MVTALAAPYLYERRLAHERSGRDLVLVLDASGSMAESGFDTQMPQKRKFDVVKSIVADFIQKRFDDNIGLVIFGTFAFTASPVTYDIKALKQILEMVDVSIAGQNTAIGEGISQALRSLGFVHADKKVIVLLTDGRHNSGSVSLASAVEEARMKRVKIYAIGIGKPGNYDSSLLKRVARETGGEMFGATNAKELEAVYERIDSLEPSPLPSEDRVNRKPLYLFLVAIALLLLFVRMARGALFAGGRW